MKKILNVALFLLFIGASANAQFFIGGGFSFSSEGGSSTYNGNTTDKESKTSFVFTPKAGYFLTDKFAFGGQLIVISSKVPQDNGSITKGSGFGIAPFARYYALNWNKFSLFGEAELSFLFGKTKTEMNGVSSDGPKATAIGLNVTPGIAYALSDKVELEGKINLFNFGYNYQSTKTEVAGYEGTDKTSSFGFGVGMDDVVNTGDFSIGLIIKF
jgi:outer membrane protein